MEKAYVSNGHESRLRHKMQEGSLDEGSSQTVYLFPPFKFKTCFFLSAGGYVTNWTCVNISKDDGVSGQRHEGKVVPWTQRCF